MHRLLLMRHGKSDWDADFDEDHERPLAKRGVRAAKAIGRLLQSMGEVPDLVVASPAVRARSTAELAHDAGRWDCEIVHDESLYDATTEDTLAAVARHGEGVARLMLVGHDPTWSQLLTRLTGARAPVKTASVAAVDLVGCDWTTTAGAELVYLLPGRMGDGKGI